MTHTPARWLLVSTALEILASSLLGYVMLIPMQPWGKWLRGRADSAGLSPAEPSREVQGTLRGFLQKHWPAPRALMSVHLDMVMLALMQAAAALGVYAFPNAHDPTAARLLIASAWLNVTPYAWRMVGMNAFALAGGAVQRFAASLSFVGTVALSAGWVLLIAGWVR